MTISRWWQRWAMQILTCGGIASGLLQPLARAAELDVNLVVNAGFEDVDTNVTAGQYNAPRIAGWSTTANGLFAYSHDGSGGVPDFANGGPLATGGSYYFSPNASTPDITAAGQAFQVVDLSQGDAAARIAQGQAAFSLRGAFSSYASDGDRGALQVDFLDGNSGVLASARIGDRNPTAWSEHGISGAIPAGTTAARVSLLSSAVAGGPDGYIDQVDFRVSDASLRDPNTLRVMTFNVWSGENSAAGRERLEQIIRASNADVVGLQEMGASQGQAIADALGFHYHQQSSGGIQILSRFPVVGQSPANLGAQIELAPGRNVWLFNAHLAAYPYQPYDLRDGTLPQDEAAVIAAANAARGSQVTSYLNDMQGALQSSLPVFLTGDFNEPSHLDWTQEAADATPREFDLAVQYPTSHRIASSGLIDSVRQLRPDVVNDPAYTWTPGYPPPNLEANEVYDRIDIVYHRGAGIVPIEVVNIGFDINDGSTDMAVAGYNSDHRAVVVTYTIPDSCFLLGDFNGDCQLDSLDWQILRDNQHVSLIGFTPQEAYLRGDLNGDLANNHADFVLFKSEFERVNGQGSFATMLTAVPELPSSHLVIYTVGLAVAQVFRLHHQAHSQPKSTRTSR
jgi:endonuclease/exonuclease/phosphatase family metal-dependent hydrolase